MATAPVEIGQILAGKYRIDRVLGAGGMGVVVAATHLQLDQRVAIKFLLPDALSNPDVVARFQREARAAVRIQSEHVARVIDVGTLEDGAPYMVMEYLEGTDLAGKIAAERTLAVSEAVQYLLEACEALAEAHSAGIVHRDLKPANLFLARRADKTSMVKVLDFGISKSTSGASTGGALTSTQAVMGSPYYMSPEQLMSAKHVDARADVWSLGVVLYESLVGSPPYGGDTMPEIVAQILQAPAPSVCAQRPDAPREVDRIVATCLAKDPGARYQDVAALARDLATLVPDGARSVDRIARVLGASVRPPSPSLSGAQPAPPAQATPLPGGRGATLALQRPGSKAAATSQPQAWGATQTPAALPRRSNALLFAAVAGGVLALGAGGVALLHRARPTPEPASLVESPVAPSASAASLAIPPPPSLASTTEPQPSASASAPAAPRATVAATTRRPPAHGAAHAHATAVAAATHAATATTKPPPPPPPPHNALDMNIK